MHACLICAACGARLSDPIRIRVVDDPSALPAMEDVKPVTLAGEAIRSCQPMQHSFDPAKPAPLEFVPQFWMNPADVDDQVESVENACRLNGCCGLDGCDGPNMRCKACHQEVGTRQSDCWTADVFIPEPAGTKWIEIEQ